MKCKKNYLLTPGPTPIPDDILVEMAKPIIHHRTPQFCEIFTQVSEGLKYLFQTQSDVYTLTSSGTGAMEAACVNLVGPKEKALVVCSGKFGERWSEILSAYGALPQNIDVPYGEAVDPNLIKNALQKDPQIKAVFTTHCETSTGILTDIEAIAKITAEHQAVLVTDAVSSLGACRLAMDAWGVDVIVSGSQKGLMLPPGLAFIALSQKAWKRVEQVQSHGYYFDLLAYRKTFAKQDTPWTPAVTLVIGLKKALDMIKAEGLDEIFARHARMAQATRKAVTELGLTLFAKKPADVLTAVHVPAGIDGKKLVKTLRDEYGVSIAGGQGSMEGKIFRIAHLGYMGTFDVIIGISALEIVLKKMGYAVPLGAGVKAAEEVLG